MERCALSMLLPPPPPSPVRQASLFFPTVPSAHPQENQEWFSPMGVRDSEVRAEQAYTARQKYQILAQAEGLIITTDLDYVQHFTGILVVSPSPLKLRH
jgi:hypothetical protein